MQPQERGGMQKTGDGETKNKKLTCHLGRQDAKLKVCSGPKRPRLNEIKNKTDRIPLGRLDGERKWKPLLIWRMKGQWGKDRGPQVSL